MASAYMHQADTDGIKSVANAAFGIVRNTDFYCGNNELGSRIAAIVPKNHTDYELLKTHKYVIISMMTEKRNLYGFGHFPGAYLITNYYTPSEQVLIANSILTRHINPPNASNITKLDQRITNLLDSEKFVKRFKWATCGEQYDWGERKYLKSLKLHEDFLAISQEIISNVYPEVDNHIPDAVIINLYNGNYRLNMHKEDAEESDAPVVTISLGKSAIFMIGKDNFNSLPMAIVVNSGDIFIMSKECRFSLHGIAKLVHAPIPCCSSDDRVFGNPVLIREIHRQIDQNDILPKNVKHDVDERIEGILGTCRLSISIRKAKS